jgi:FG-GAP-like repeat
MSQHDLPMSLRARRPGGPSWLVTGTQGKVGRSVSSHQSRHVATGALASAVLATLLAASPNGWREPAGAFELHVIDRTIGQPWLKSVGDLDRDGRPDMLVGGAEAGGLVAYLNRYPRWAREVLDPARKFATDGEVRDVDGDGRNDVVALTRSPDGVVWYRNTGSGWEIHPINGQTWHDVEVADFDGDGAVDLVGRNQKEWPHDQDAGNQLHFAWQRRENGTIGWDHDGLECPAGEGLLAADLDRDGDVDVAINEWWYENLGGRRWQAHRYASDGAWTHPNTYLAAGDLNGDGRLDIVVSPSELKGGRYKIAWFEAPADPRAGVWLAHVIVADVETVVHFVGVADFDGDGRPDVATAEMPQGSDPDEVCVFLNRGRDRDGRWDDSWEKLVVSTDGSHGMRIFDADGDGRPDLFGANWSAQGRDEDVKLWLNRMR